MSFNLKTIKTLESFEVEIKDEEGNGTGVFFTLAGPNHHVRRTAQLALNRKMIAQANKTGKVELPDPEDAEKDRMKNLASATLAWRGYANDEGQEIQFSPSAALELYQDPEMMWLVDQVDTALGAKERFTKRTSGK